MTEWIRDNWTLIVGLCCLFVAAVLILVINSRIENIANDVKSKESELHILCINNGYIGHDYVNNQPVCYGYIDGNKMVIKLLDEIESAE